MNHLLLILFFLASFNGYCQQYVGLSTSNYGGVHSIYANPASITGGKMAFYLNLVAADAQINNNYLQYESSAPFPSLLANGADFKQEHFQEVGSADQHFFSSNADARGLGMLIRVNPKHAFAISTRYRAFAQGNNLSGGLADLLWTQMNKGVIEEALYEHQNLQFNTDVFSEVALTYAVTLWQTDGHAIKLGTTGKRVYGYYVAHAEIKNFTYQTRTLEDGTSELDISSLDVHYGYSRFGASAEKNYKNLLFMQNSITQGWAAEVGLQYEYYSKKDQNLYQNDSTSLKPYKVKAGLAMMDIGKLKYYDMSNIHGYEISRQNLQINSSRFEEAQWQDVDIMLYDALNVKAEEQISSYVVRLPTALNVNLDYRFTNHLYANLLWVKGFNHDDASTIKQFDYLTFIPRYEFRGFELAIPLTLHHQYQEFSLGAMLRLGPLVLGSTNILGALGLQEAYSVNTYAALVIPVQFKKVH